MDGDSDPNMYEHVQVKIELDIGPTVVQYNVTPKSIEDQTIGKFGKDKMTTLEPILQSIKVEYSSDDNSSTLEQKVEQQLEDNGDVQNDIVEVNNLTREKLLASNVYKVDGQRSFIRWKSAENLFSDQDDELQPRTISIIGLEQHAAPMLKPAIAVGQRNTFTDARTFTCEICNAKLTRCTSLVEHRRIHTGEKPYTCETCDLKFRRSSDLSRHKKKHTDSKSYSCDVCNLKLKSFLTLKDHRRIHTGERPYRCVMCHAKFRTSNGLARHKEVHINGSKFHCEMCNKKFTCSNDLKRHKQTYCNMSVANSLRKFQNEPNDYILRFC